jgi:cytochrome P450
LYPEYLEPLRAEIADHVQSDESFGDIKVLNSLYLLDSFIRETMRHYPAACFFGQRTSREEVVLDDLRMPPKSRIAFPTLGINKDPENHKDASVFDSVVFKPELVEPMESSAINRASSQVKP